MHEQHVRPRRPARGRRSAAGRRRDAAPLRICSRFAVGLALAAAAALAALAALPAHAADAARLQVERFRVEGATLVAPERIAEVLAPFHGPRTLAELNAAAEAVQRLYADAGWGGVVAYLPPQTAADGSVTVVVVEGKLARITVRGAADAAAEAAVRAALPALAPGQTPALRTIDTQLQLANENPARQLQLVLAPGEKPGEVAAEVALRGRDPLQFALALDDTGNQRTGRWRLAAVLQHADLSGVGDVGTLFVQTSPTEAKKFAVASLGYRRPIASWATLAEVYAAYSDIDGGSSPTAAGAVRLNGRGSVVGLRGTRFLPRAGEVDQRLVGALERREYLNSCAVENLPPEACGGAGTDVAVAPLSLDYTLRGGGELAWTVTLGAAYNVGAGGSNAGQDRFDVLRPGAEVHYALGRIGLSLRGGAGDWQWSARLNGQWTGDALVSGEQFGIGGANSVRGYEERELIGDRGAAAALELITPEWLERATAAAPTLRAFAFADAGVVSNLLETPCRLSNTRCPIASWGLGLNWGWGGWSLRLTGAVALRDALTTRADDTRAHVAAQALF